MTSTNAERQRRFRAHARDDHSLCLPGRPCNPSGEPIPSRTVTPSQPVTPAGPKPPKLNAGGRRLWDELDADKLTAGQRVLAVEACRIVDRLDKFDRLLSGDAADWLDLIERRGQESIAEVVIDKPVAEARQQALALKQIIAELRAAAGSVAAAPAAPGASAAGEQEGSYVDQLAARRAARVADAAGR